MMIATTVGRRIGWLRVPSLQLDELGHEGTQPNCLPTAGSPSGSSDTDQARASQQQSEFQAFGISSWDERM